MDQIDLIHQTDWKNLIILDSCRFDLFSDIYSNYFNGALQCVDSPAGSTHEWLRKVFPNFYDSTMYSAHPAVNNEDRETLGYQANMHFLNVNHLVGDYGAGEINKRILNDIHGQQWHGRNIIWYNQPHLPWLGKTRADLAIYEDLRNGVWDREFVVKAYKENLQYVLRYVHQLVNRLWGKTVITSDHGELLLDENLPPTKQFGHCQELYQFRCELREVPWLEIDKPKRVIRPQYVDSLIKSKQTHL